VREFKPRHFVDFLDFFQERFARTKANRADGAIARNPASTSDRRSAALAARPCGASVSKACIADFGGVTAMAKPYLFFLCSHVKNSP